LAYATPICTDLSYANPSDGICIDTFDHPPVSLGNTSPLVPEWSITGDVSRFAASGGAGIVNTHLVLSGDATAHWLTPWIVQALPAPGTFPPEVPVLNNYNFQWGDYHEAGTSGRVSWYAGDMLIQQTQILPSSSEGFFQDGRFFFTVQGRGFDVGCLSLFGCDNRDPNDPRIGQQISVQFETFTGQLRLDNVFVRHEFSAIPEPGTLALLGIGLAGLAVMRRCKQ
jgi:hypothetical protein